MPVNLEDRPIETVRQQVIDQLMFNYSHGELSETAFERRLDQAMDSQSNQELVDLVADLELQTDSQYQALRQQASAVQYSTIKGEHQKNLFTIFSSEKVSGTWLVPNNITIYSLFGGSEIDFSQAKFQSPNVNIKIYSLFSGNEFFLPEQINVNTSTVSIFSGVENHTASHHSQHSPILHVEGVILFSGLNFKIKTPFKEQFFNLAKSIRALFVDSSDSKYKNS